MKDFSSFSVYAIHATHTHTHTHTHPSRSTAPEVTLSKERWENKMILRCWEAICGNHQAQNSPWKYESFSVLKDVIRVKDTFFWGWAEMSPISGGSGYIWKMESNQFCSPEGQVEDSHFLPIQLKTMRREKKKKKNGALPSLSGLRHELSIRSWKTSRVF